nr:MAG TPA: hypothetical protein [Caudoviricetes sp.]
MADYSICILLYVSWSTSLQNKYNGKFSICQQFDRKFYIIL